MKQSKFLRTSEVFPGSNVVRKDSFKAMGTRDSYALLAKANHICAIDFAVLRERSALFEDDCFECLSPHKIAV